VSVLEKTVNGLFWGLILRYDQELSLRAFAKLQEATNGFVMSVRLSAWNNSAPTGRIFIKFDI
jgi:hypothetical protein